MPLPATIGATLVFLAAMQQAPSRPTAPRIAVINLTEVFERYQMTRDLEHLFADRRSKLTAEGEKQRDEINLQRNALQQFKPGTRDYEDREESLVRKEISFQVWLEVQERRLKDEHKAWLEQIYRDVQNAVASIAAARGVDLVLTYNDLDEDAPDSVAFKQQILLRTVIYAHDSINLTEPVVEMIDGGYQKRGGAASLQHPHRRTGTAPDDARGSRGP